MEMETVMNQTNIAEETTYEETIATSGAEKVCSAPAEGDAPAWKIFDAVASWFDEAERSGICVTPEQRAKIEQKIDDIVNYEPHIGILGKTGAGKSSLCNTLFGQDVCEIDDVDACTRNPQAVTLHLGENNIKLIDVPGMGEDQDKDEEYAKLYRELLPQMDLVLWVMKADDRAIAEDKRFYKELVLPALEDNKPFFLVVNQVDKMEPLHTWDSVQREPSAEQLQNICRKVDTLATQFGIPASHIIPVSAQQQYNLVKLVDEIVYALPKEQAASVFYAVQAAYRTDCTEEHVRSSILETIGDAINDVIIEVSTAIECFIDDIVFWLKDRVTNSD